MGNEPTFKVPDKRKTKIKWHGNKQANKDTKLDEKESESDEGTSKENIKEFLRITKWQKNIVIEEYFSDCRQFVYDVKYFKWEGWNLL